MGRAVVAICELLARVALDSWGAVWRLVVLVVFFAAVSGVLHVVWNVA
jgi:hypothetical protein